MDLDARFSELADADMLAELADRERVAVGSVDTVQRLAGALGAPLRVRVSTGAVVEGVLGTVGSDWLLLRQQPGRELLVALRAVIAVDGLTGATATAPSPRALRLDLRYALRGLVRDRAPVALTTLSSAPVGGPSSELTGTLDRVGRDFVELALHAPWEPRRAAAVRAVVLVPLAAIATARPMPWG